MGVTSRIYSLKKKDFSIHHVIEMMKKINKNLCIGSEKIFQYQFNLDEPERLEEIKNKYKIYTPNLLLGYKIDDSNQLNNIFNTSDLYERAWFFNCKDTNSGKNYTSYWIDLKKELQQFSFSIVLPYEAEVEYSKTELYKVLRYLVSKGLISLLNKKIDDLCDVITDFNSTSHSDEWEFKNNLIISAKRNFTPKGSSQKKASNVKFHFDKKEYERYGGYEKMAIVFHKALNKYFSDPMYYVQGTIVSKFDSEILKHISGVKLSDLKIPMNIDVESKPDFSYSDLEFSSKEESCLVVDCFDWLGSNPNQGCNMMTLCIKNPQEYEFEIHISKQIDDYYFTEIEKLIENKLEYKGVV